MRSMISTLALVCFAGMAPLSAQMAGPPGGPPGGGGMHRMSAAALFLGHTGDLQLTDQQVTKLAGIARRSAERHKAMRASFDSAAHAIMGGGRPMRGDTAGRGARRTAMMEAFKKAHEAEHADLRDALTVLTPDQLAKAWEMVAARQHRHFGRGGRHGMMGGRG